AAVLEEVRDGSVGGDGLWVGQLVMSYLPASQAPVVPRPGAPAVLLLGWDAGEHGRTQAERELIRKRSFRGLRPAARLDEGVRHVRGVAPVRASEAML